MNVSGISIPRTRETQMDYDPQSRELRDVKDRAWLMREAIRNLQSLGAPSKIAPGDVATYTTALGTMMTHLTSLIADVVAIEALFTL